MTSILLVEDDPRGLQSVVEILAELPGQVVPVIAKSRAAALAVLESQFFDLMILDLSIPAEDGGEVAQPEFGFAVFGRAKEIAPGMPIFLFTGSSTEEFVADLLERKQTIEVWGPTKVNTVAVQKKLRLEEFSGALRPFVAGPHALDEVELQRDGLVLSTEQQRLLRIFAKRFRGTKCVVSALDDGLSGARVLRVTLQDAQGGIIHHAVAKIAGIAAIREEKDLYEMFVNRLRPAVTPRLLVALEFGAKATGAVFYGLAAGHDSTFFKVDLANGGLVTEAVIRTEDCMREWCEAGARNLHSVADIRSRLVSDATRAELLPQYDLAWTAAFENTNVNANWGCIHGDCHGGNILLTAAGVPMVIDYGDVGPGALTLDPVTLELSIFFHPSGPLVNSAWPSPENALNWGNLDLYLDGCPCPTFIAQCRTWANRVAGGNRELAASGYTYLLRQLKYPNTNKVRAMNLLAGVRRLYEST